MNRIELYKKTEGVLYQAYFDDTLKHGNCAACAVGNICVEAARKTRLTNYMWNLLFMTDPDTMIQQEFRINPDNSGDRAALNLVAATGYTKKELMRIEWAFESASKGFCSEDYMFNGLVAVLEVLKEIHELTDEDMDLGKFRVVHERNATLV